MERIPTGFCNKAQGCEERATLGKGGRCFTTPTGLGPGCAAVAVGRNPFRVVIDRTHDPRVARPSQPWALLRNPFGIRRPHCLSPPRNQTELRAFDPAGCDAGADENVLASLAFETGGFSGGEFGEDLRFAGRREAQGSFFGENDAEL